MILATYMYVYTYMDIYMYFHTRRVNEESKREKERREREKEKGREREKCTDAPVITVRFSSRDKIFDSLSFFPSVYLSTRVSFSLFLSRTQRLCFERNTRGRAHALKRRIARLRRLSSIISPSFHFFLFFSLKLHNDRRRDLSRAATSAVAARDASA
jgi:hypothetical protein